MPSATCPPHVHTNMYVAKRHANGVSTACVYYGKDLLYVSLRRLECEGDRKKVCGYEAWKKIIYSKPTCSLHSDTVPMHLVLLISTPEDKAFQHQ